MSSIVFDKERLKDAILVLAEFSRIGRVFPVLADFFRIGRVCSVLAKFVIGMMRADFAVQMLY